MTLSADDMDNLLATLAVVTPATIDAVLARGWELVFHGEDVTLAETQMAMVAVAKQKTWCSPAEALAEVREQRKARLAAADVHRGDQAALEVGEPVYPPGHDQAGESIDPDDMPAYLEAVRARRFAAASRPTDQDRSADMARLLPGWKPTGPRAIGGGR